MLRLFSDAVKKVRKALSCDILEITEASLVVIVSTKWAKLLNRNEFELISQFIKKNSTPF